MNFNLLGKKTFDLDEIEKLYKVSEYNELVNIINSLTIENKIIPVISSGGNGKVPTLYKKYRVVIREENNEEILNEINYKLSSRFNTTYYENHLEKYKDSRGDILKLNDFIINNSKLLEEKISMNERSFQIWGREKFLQREGGKTILKNLGVALEFLNYYDTSEPIAYYSHNKNTPQNILIIENKDTYYTFRNHLIRGDNKVLGEQIDTIIYGGGKNVIKAFNDFKISVEDHVSNISNKFYYFGDLDYEGIGIYEGFYKNFSKEYNLYPFVNGYKKMIDKVKEFNVNLPETKEGQNRNIHELFFEQFNNTLENFIDYKREMKYILENNLYIPQEIINISDL